MRILIAGATSGIGAALLACLKSDGHEVEGFGRATCDISYEPDVTRFFAARVLPLDALVITAGTFGAIGRAAYTQTDEWVSAWTTNVLGPYLLVKHGLPLLIQGERPRIITFSGGGAFGPFARYSAYASSKAALVRLTETLAEELRPKGIAVNAVAPGMVNTRIHEQTLRAGRDRAGAVQFAKTLEMQETGGVPMAVPVNCIRWLLSKEADRITGRTIAAAFDPWGTPAFAERCASDPDYCTLRRQT